jgi:hypothetical protein
MAKVLQTRAPVSPELGRTVASRASRARAAAGVSSLVPGRVPSLQPWPPNQNRFVRSEGSAYHPADGGAGRAAEPESLTEPRFGIARPDC